MSLCKGVYVSVISILTFHRMTFKINTKFYNDLREDTISTTFLMKYKLDSSINFENYSFPPSRRKLCN